MKALFIILALFTTQAFASGPAVYFNVATDDGVWRGIDCDLPVFDIHYHFPSDGKESPYGTISTQNCEYFYMTDSYPFPPDYELPTYFDMDVHLNGLDFSNCAPVFSARMPVRPGEYYEVHLYTCITISKLGRQQ